MMTRRLPRSLVCILVAVAWAPSTASGETSRYAVPWAGGTIAPGNTVVIEDGGSITAAVVANGMLRFERSGTLTVSSMISGTGSLAIAGTGTVALAGLTSGTANYDLAISVPNGQLLIGREPDFDTAIGLLADEGRMVLMAGRDARPPFPVGPFYVKQAKLMGFVMFKASAELQAAAARDINGWLTSGRLRAPIAAVMPLAETAAAHRLQEEATISRAGSLVGKIVVEP